MKLIIQIPCFNEEKTLPLVLQELPKSLPGITSIETLIIDDGSHDKTIEIAKKHKVSHILTHKKNLWLGQAFKTWIEYALKQGADIVVNTDGDNQYPWSYIADLIVPIIEGKADIVIWNRQTSKVKHFSFIKKIFQALWSMLVRFFSGTEVPDSVSGFRAYSRETLLRLNITSRFSYAVDTLVQAGSKNMHISYISMHINKPTRPSRLFKNIFEHMYKTFFILMRVYAMYHPLRLFSSIGAIFFIAWSLWVFRFLYLFITLPWPTGHIQSLILSWVCLSIASVLFALGIIGDLIAKNRALIEEQLYFTKKTYFSQK